MDGSMPKSATSFEVLVIQNLSYNDLKNKLNEIICKGKDYQYDVSACLKSLLKNNDQDIVQLSVEAISELAKCEDKREIYAQKDIVQPILDIIKNHMAPEQKYLLKQCCRALGNLCCDCDNSRKVILDCNGLPVLSNLLEKSFEHLMNEIKLLLLKTLLNYSIGGKEFTESILQGDLIDVLRKVLEIELYKKNSDDEVTSTVLLILGVISDNSSELLYEEDVNKVVLNTLRETSSIEISELCLDHLHSQAEHDSVKLLLAKEGGVQLVCSRLELFIRKHSASEVNADDCEIESIMKQACDLIIIVLTGDEAMHILYNNGVGEVYLSMIKWLDSPNYHLLTTAVLAIGNFARRDDYCANMMDDKIYDKLLDIFEVYHGFAVRMNKEPEKTHLIDMTTVMKIEHAVLSALRNLTVPVNNKRLAAAKGRAAPVLLQALPHVEEHYVAYKMLAAIRMLVDGQESVAKQLACDPAALASVARWGLCGESAGAAGEAPRLLAWAVKLLIRDTHWRCILQVEGCITSLVNMLLASHSLMQNEAILALTLLAIESLKKDSPDTEHPVDYEKSYITQLLNSEIGKHIAVLVDTNCAKMPLEVAENLIAFLDITTKKNKLTLDYKEAKLQDSLRKFCDSRNDFSDDLKSCVSAVITAISDNDKVY